MEDDSSSSGSSSEGSVEREEGSSLVGKSDEGTLFEEEDFGSLLLISNVERSLSNSFSNAVYSESVLR